ncbi:MAG TPA: asparagine synthase-related protein, partial [Pyrinomonadaceae bacterium]|nr:asparagine synthase-related protein [Pyrinomonadaceae bacterium]
LAGEPLLALGDDDSWQTRARDLEALHEGWKRGDWGLLSRARGVFCAAHYQSGAGSLSLIADKLCIRPLYYRIDDEYVIFATALRIFEGLAGLPKRMDVRAVTELVGLGVPLGTRTPLAGVELLKAAEVIRVDDEKVTRRQYWRWDQIEASTAPEPELLRETYGRFSRAVGRRLRGDRTAAAFLSGGLDSRCVVAALVGRGVRVHTFNFALPGTQDQVFGAEFARAAGTIHSEAPMKPGAPNWTKIMADAWNASPGRAEWPAERPALVWSGDGGSVGLGHVYVSPAIVELMREGQTAAAVEAYLQQEHASVPRRLLRGDVSDALSHTLYEGIREELADIHCDDPGRSFHVFLMLNDQRRHLAGHFENIDLHRIEFQLPFMDSDFLAAVMSVPLDLCLRHKFYTKWLKLFPPPVTSVPWQTYPHHEPCPLPVPQALTYQWDRAHPSARSAARRRELLKQGAEVLGAKDFPDRILKRGYLRLASWAHRTGLRDYGYVIEAAQTYHKYWQLCGGQYVLPSVP